MKRTLVLGASPNPTRYSNKVTHQLLKHGHEVVLVGQREGEIKGVPIAINKPKVEGIDTITLYLGPQNQPPFYDYIMKEIQPERIIFNPGTENSDFEKLAREQGIITLTACTLVLLSIGNY